MIQAVIHLLSFVGSVLAGILFLVWLYLVGRNARALGAKHMRFTPGWAVGWYFVPVASLWKPYQSMKELFKASNPAHGSDWRQAPHPTFLPLWWTLWLSTTLGWYVSLRVSFRAERLEQMILGSWIEILSGVLEIPLAITAIVLVATMQRWQDEKRRQPMLPPTASDARE